MKRFILSSASVLLAAAAIAPAVQAAPTVSKDFNLQTLRLQELDSRTKSKGFNLQTLRLQELDSRTKSEDASQPYYYEQPSSAPAAQPASETVTDEPAYAQPAESATWEAPEVEAESPAPALSLTERRHQALDIRR
ncbi:MAG: hypothetical protein AAFU53_12000 [Cyanobacteria bacterium J06632_3]